MFSLLIQLFKAQREKSIESGLIQPRFSYYTSKKLCDPVLVTALFALFLICKMSTLDRIISKGPFNCKIL